MLCCVLEPGIEAESVCIRRTHNVETHQRIRGFSVWPNPPLPRTSGTNKLKRVEISKWVNSGRQSVAADNTELPEVFRRFAGGQDRLNTPLDDLALSSLDRIQLLMELEQRTGTSVSESQFASAKKVADLMRVQPAQLEESFDFPEWNRSRPARWLRRIALPGLILPLARMFAWIRTRASEPATDRAPGDFRIEPPEPLRCARNHGRAAAEVALSRVTRDGERIFRCTFSPGPLPA